MCISLEGTDVSKKQHSTRYSPCLHDPWRLWVLDLDRSNQR
jgi:hypothetical protein